MQLLRGRDLARVAYEDGPLPFGRILAIFRQVLAALAEAHHHGIVHRDLKPENVILERDRNGRDFVKVVDFGLAKLREPAGPKGRNITSPGTVCGTPDYMAPEQGRGDPIDGRSDLYGVGIILYQLLTGRLPFEAESSRDTVLLRQTASPPDPRVAAPQRRIPDSLALAVMRALEPEPDARWSDADQFAEALERVATEIESTERARSPRVLTCRACGGAVPLAQKFCGECGHRMPQGASASTPGSDPRLRLTPAIDVAQLPLPLIAREGDLAWLRGQRSERRPAVAGARVVAEPGYGKTRLLREMLLACAAEGDVVVRTGPDPWWADVGYWALRQAVCGLASIDPRGDEREWIGASPEARRGLLEIFARVDATSITIPPDQRRWMAAEALRWAFARAGALAMDARIVLVVDDLHRVDGASLHAFSDVLHEPPLVGALLIGAHVPSFDPGWPATVPVRSLGGVPGAVVARMLARSAQPFGARDDESQRALAPLHVEHLLRFATEGGTDAPRRLADLVAVRMERLGPDARSVVQALAVLGDDVSVRELHTLVPEGPMSRTATGTVESAVAQSVGALVAAGIVEQTERGLRLSHPLVREIASATIPAAVRRELHARAARLAQAQRLPLEVVALHATLAEDAFEGLVLMEQVADRALARGDAAGAALALRRGLDLASRQMGRNGLDDARDAVLIFARKLGEALARDGRVEEAAAQLEQALESAPKRGLERARILRALATVAFQRDRGGEAARWLEEARELAARSGAHELVASIDDMQRGWAS
jgi:serine/threonine-protein kinase